MRALLFLNGTIHRELNINKDNFDLIVAANGGCNNAYKLNIKPHILIGDLDSINKNIKKWIKGTKTILFPKYKDKSDGELALIYLKKNGFTDITIIGTAGKRFDHTLTNMFMIASFSKYMDFKLIEREFICYFLYGNNEIEISTGHYKIFSIIPFKQSVISIKGAKYNLNRSTISPGKSLTLSNITTDNKLIIKLYKGNIAIIINNKNSRDI